jgi:trehalose 6-phosphate phosphatase
MRHILAPRHRPALEHFAAASALLAFDYDGTLAPIVGDPSRARLRARTRRLLIAVAERYPCIVISGRSCEDVAARLEDVPLWTVFGNHGWPPWGRHPPYATHVHEWAASLRRRLRDYPGVIVEDKTYSVAVHYRCVRRKRAVRDAIRDAVADLQGVRVIGGKESVNLVPLGAPNKGTALEWARTILACDCAVYLGDDDTDEDAFGAATADRLLSIRVGAARASTARYYVRRQQDVDALLDVLVSLRPRRQPPADRALLPAGDSVGPGAV